MSSESGAEQRRQLLRVSGVNKGFPGVQALSDMQLDLYGGEVLALVGENGAGKSTLMKLLSGIYTPDTGTFEVDGQEVEIHNTRRARELGIGIIHQEFNLMPALTVAQNIFIGRQPQWGGFFLKERELNRRTQELLDSTGIILDPRARVSDLTVAKQQMVEIAKALSGQSRILIMDEPTAALNDAEVEVLHNVIRDFITPTTAVIYISHRMEELSAISNRVTVIRDGQFVKTLNTAETTNREVISLMVGRAIDTNQRPQVLEREPETILRVRDLNTKALLRDINLDVRRGEILGVAGLMGAGRTELARAIVGADKISSGSIEMHGSTVSIANPAAAAARGIGYLSEDRKQLGLMLERDVKDNVALTSLPAFSRFGFLHDSAMSKRAQEYVSSLKIKTPSVRQPVRFLSGGNQQKVVIAKWLLRECEVLIFDEPTRGIDVGAKEEIYTLLNKLAQEGTSIVMISSELPEVLRLSQRIAVMSAGRITGILDNTASAGVTQEDIMSLATAHMPTNVNQVSAGAPHAASARNQ